MLSSTDDDTGGHVEAYNSGFKALVEKWRTQSLVGLVLGTSRSSEGQTINTRNLNDPGDEPS